MMNIEDFKELLTEHGLKVSKTRTLPTEIDRCLDYFLLDLKSQLERNNLQNDKIEIVNNIVFDLDTYRIENTSIGQGNKHNNAIINALEYAYDCVINHVK